MSRRGENIYKRKDGRWEGRILNPNGKYSYVYGKSYREVKEKKKNITNNLSDMQDIKISKLSATALFKDWLLHQSTGRVRRSTYDSYYCCICKYVIPFFQSGEDHLSEHRVEQFVQFILLNQQLSAAYRRKIISIFKTAIRAITKDNRLSLLVANYLRITKTNNPVTVFTPNEQIRIEQAILNLNDFRAYGILLCFYTGIRLGELCALRWENLDLDTRIMSITATASRVNNYNQSDPKEHKTILITGAPKSKNSGRRIPIPKFLIDLIKKNMPNGMENYVFSSTDKPAEPRTMQRLYKRILRIANVKERKFHTIRHTFATRALELGIDIKTLSEILGHSSVAITLNIYAHSMLEQKKIAIEKMNSMYLSHTLTGICAVNGVVN